MSISIHAPRGGSDAFSPAFGSFLGNFNPRSPWGERLLGVSRLDGSAQSFQSTLPVGGATEVLSVPPFTLRISIHAPRGGSDTSSRGRPAARFQFQSTLPVGGATVLRPKKGKDGKISIHAPRGGSDG